jgi:hypothetical protein
MAVKPFANAPHAIETITGDWLVGIQVGSATGSAGVAQMKYLRLIELADWVKVNFGQMWRYRGECSSATPTDPMNGDYFVATASFDTFEANHIYAYNGNTWDDVSNVLTQYAQQTQVTEIDNRLTTVEITVASITAGVVFKGDCTYAELLAIQNPVNGWEYWVTDRNAFYIYSSDESAWRSMGAAISQTPDETDVSHPLSNAATTTLVNTSIEQLTDGTLTAKKAEQDGDGNVIKTTYATKSELQTHVNDFDALGLSVVDGAINITYTE